MGVMALRNSSVMFLLAIVAMLVAPIAGFIAFFAMGVFFFGGGLDGGEAERDAQDDAVLLVAQQALSAQTYRASAILVDPFPDRYSGCATVSYDLIPGSAHRQDRLTIYLLDRRGKWVPTWTDAPSPDAEPGAADSAGSAELSRCIGRAAGSSTGSAWPLGVRDLLLGAAPGAPEPSRSSPS